MTQVKKVQVNHTQECEGESDSEINWLLDSGCSDHIVASDKYFSKYVILKAPIDVSMPDGKNLKATKLGTIRMYFENGNENVEVILKNVYYVKGIKRNLLSTSKITENNNTVVIKNDCAKIYNKNKKLVAVAERKKGLYIMKSFIYEKNNSEIVFTNMVKLTNKEKWHRALGHINFQYLDRLVNEKLIEGLPDRLENIIMKCATCIQSKMANVPFENKSTNFKDVLELIHTDLNGPRRTVGFGGERYFLSFIDDFSKCSKTYCIKSKAETASCFIDYVNHVENQLDKNIKKIKCDNGKEYLNKEIYNFLRFKGIELIPCPPYVHELNGVAERFNRSAMDMGRCLAKEANINLRYWPEIIKTVSYLKNRTIANTQQNKTPFEIMWGKKPNVKNLKIYGSKVFVRTPETLRKGKWDDKAKMGILVGYTHNGYRVLLNNKIINARHIKVIENDKELICLGKVDENQCKNDKSLDLDFEAISEADSSENDLNETNDSFNDANDDFAEEQINQENENVNDLQNINENIPNNDQLVLNVPRRSNRAKSPVNRYGEPVSHHIYVNATGANVPNTFEEAINCDENKNWIKAMNKEIEVLNKNKTWKLVEKVPKKKIVDVKWIYTKKLDGTYKARVVARGFQQENVIDDIYAPVAKIQTLKVLLSFCCQYGLIIEQMDVVAAFLNGKISAEIYVNQPKGYNDGTERVCRLFKALYGLHESPRAWYECFDEFLRNLGFERSNVDYCLYFYKKVKLMSS